MGVKYKIQGIQWTLMRGFFVSPDHKMVIDRLGRKDYELNFLVPGTGRYRQLFRGRVGQCVAAAEYFDIINNSPTEEG